MTLKDFINFLTKNTGTIMEYTKNHFTLVLLAVTISLVIWVPVGLLLTKNDKWATRVLALANTIFCTCKWGRFLLA